MNEIEIRRGMESLWKKTFGDSEEYIKLVFDTYFNPDLIAFRVEEGIVVSSLLAIPYNFCGEKGRKDLRGLYLCGLATEEKHRRKGLMGQLIEEINKRAEELGFDFTFLVPSSVENQLYYARRGYHNAFYKVREHYVYSHHFKLEKGLEKAEFKKYAGENEAMLVDFLNKNEKGCGLCKASGEKTLYSYSLVHSVQDWKAVVKEAAISGEDIYVALDNGEIKGVAFTGSKGKGLEVKRCIVASPEYVNVLLQRIKENMGETSLVVTEDVCEASPETQVWRPFYIHNNSKDAEYEEISEVNAPFSTSSLASPYGMCRLLKVDSLIEKLGVECTEGYKGYSHKEITELLLRKPLLPKDPIGEMLGIAELELGISLLLE